MSSLFRDDTPIEIHRLDGDAIHVKRDDLYGRPPAPPLAKLRGLRLLLKRLYGCGVRLVGCWDTRVSKLGQGLAACCREFPGLRCIVSYPTKKGTQCPQSLQVASGLGAEIYPVPGSRIRISFARARSYIEGRGGVMLPFGLECEEAVDGVRRAAAKVPRKFLLGGTLVLCCGSGVTLAGLLGGLPVLPRRIIGVSSGRATSNILACLRRYAGDVPACLDLQEAETAYSIAASFPCPFPAHPHYDLKAWQFLCENREHLSKPILFWNIGA